MCLGIPGKITQVEGKTATVDIGGVSRQVSLQLLDNVAVGDYVLLHSGFAIQKMDEQEAKETLDLLRELTNYSFPFVLFVVNYAIY
ncbi:MAG: HypC/HybG/HupF family hydrogenase formation chaperone [bacterium]|nr:HypC/HybG/HupF family hydrogenase formation chaperone [bacterium]